MLPKPARLLQKYFDKYDAFPDWDPLRTERTDVVLRMILPDAKGDILEIGAHRGRTTQVFCAVAKEYGRTVYVVDPWDGRQQGSNKVFGEFNEATKDLDNLIVHKKGSEHPSVLSKFKEDNVKFAYILVDGLHSYEGVRDDITRYKDLLEPNGVICLDDWTGPYGFGIGIQRAAAECLDDNYLKIVTPDSLIEAYFVKLS